MDILSINFGHDASLCIFKDGNLFDFIEVERESRLKHHLGLKSQFILDYLMRNGMPFQTFDAICVSGTQRWPTFHDKSLQIRYGYSKLHEKLIKEFDSWSHNNLRFSSKNFNPGGNHEKNLETEGLDLQTASPVKRLWNTPILPTFIDDRKVTHRILDLQNKLTDDFIQEFQSDFFTPLTLQIDGIEKPGFYTDHHAAHANYAGYYAKENSIVVTHDGGLPLTKRSHSPKNPDQEKYFEPFNSGGVYLFEKNKGIAPILNHGFGLGYIYDRVAGNFGLDAGKLMGLASYGKFNKKINQIVDHYIMRLYQSDFSKEILNEYAQEILEISFSDHHVRNGKDKSFKFDFENPAFAIQSAANAQHFVQRIFVEQISDFCEIINEFDRSFKDVFFTGGFALNCPTNSAIMAASTALNYKPLPGVGDTGLSLGAAVALHFFLRLDLQLENSNDTMAAAFPPSSLNAFEGKLNYKGLKKVKCNSEKLPEFVASELVLGKVFCIQRGRSEVGPRALGHRSIISWAGNESIRDFINERKGRENWRPLAPICSAGDFSTYFAGEVEDSLFMLTISKSKTLEVPAVTHVDNTARVQVINEGDPFLLSILKELSVLKVAPVIVNTSFNCAGEPVVETFEHAVNSFNKMGFDYLISEMDIFEKIEN